MPRPDWPGRGREAVNTQETRFRWVFDDHGTQWLVTEVPRYQAGPTPGPDSSPAQADGFVLIFRDPTDRLFGIGVDAPLLSDATDDTLLELLRAAGAS